MIDIKGFWLEQRKKKVRNFNKYSQSKCMNCGYSLGRFDRFCPRCGQRNSKKKLNLADLIREFLSSMFAYDSRVQQSFKAIITSPGKIAREYVAGKRVKYVNPFRFFIFIAVVFFLLVSWLLPYEAMHRSQNDGPDNPQENEMSVDPSAVDDSNDLSLPGMALTRKDSTERSATASEKDTIRSNVQKDVDLYRYFKKNGYQTYEKTRKELDIEDTFSNWVKYRYILSASEIEKQPANFVRFLLPKLPFFIFFFLPIFTLFSSLVYIRRDFSYTEHLVFNFYQQSVFMLILFLGLMLENVLDDVVITIACMVFLIYHILAMRNFYAQGYLKTIFKFLLLSSTYIILSLIVTFVFTALSVGFYR